MSDDAAGAWVDSARGLGEWAPAVPPRSTLFDGATSLWEGPPSVVALSRARDRFAVVEPTPGRQSETIRVIDAGSGVEFGRTATMPNVEALAFSPSGTKLAWAQFALPFDYGSVAMWEVGGESRDVESEAGRRRAVAFVDEERVLAPAGREVAVHVWEGAVLVAEPSGAIRATGARTWSLPAAAGSADVRFDEALVARFLRYPAPDEPSAIEWARVGDAEPFVVMSFGCEGPWRGAAWIPGMDALLAFTACAAHVLDARTGATARVWTADAEPIVDRRRSRRRSRLGDRRWRGDVGYLGSPVASAGARRARAPTERANRALRGP